jgi:hypothetical protein
MRLPAFAVPLPGLRWADKTHPRPAPALRSERIAEQPGYTRFAALLGLFSALAAGALIVVALASALSDDDSASGPVVSPTPSASASPTQAPSPTGEPTETAAPSITTRPTATRTPAPTASPTRPPTATPVNGLVPPGPAGRVSLAFWANALDAWWFGALPEGAATYHEGDEPPFLVTWQAQPGRDYTAEITYACRAGAAPAIDLLTGIEFAHDAVFEAEHGPGDDVPDGAVPIPATPGLEIPGANANLLYIYGGSFTLLPDGPEPAGACSGERTISVPVTATASEVILLASAWLADSADHGGTGAADSAGPIGLRVSVSGLGAASAALNADVIVP